MKKSSYTEFGRKGKIGSAIFSLSAVILLNVLLASWLFTQTTRGEIAYAAYQNGDYKTAFNEWLPLAEDGNPEAQYNIGLMYEHGRGVEENVEEAYYWYTSAATNPFLEGIPVSKAREQARNRLGDMLSYAGYATKTATGIGENNQKLYIEEATYWYELAAEDGVISAQYHLGLHAALGRGMEQDYPTALKWYLRAAQQGHPEAQNNLATLYADGLGTKTNAEEAVYWYREASKRENITAQYNLGVMHIRGEGVSQSYVSGYMWAYLAKEEEHSGSEKLIKQLEEFMTPEDISKAKVLAEECRELGYQNCGE